MGVEMEFSEYQQNLKFFGDAVVVNVISGLVNFGRGRLLFEGLVKWHGSKIRPRRGLLEGHVIRRPQSCSLLSMLFSNLFTIKKLTLTFCNSHSRTTKTKC